MAKPQGRFSRWFERVALGGIMSVAAFVVERRLLKVIRERGKEDAEAAAPGAGEEPGRGNSADLGTPAP